MSGSSLGLGGSAKLQLQLQHQQQKKKPSSSSSSLFNREELSLPPNVNGRRRGSLAVRLAGIRWTSAKSYPVVEVRLLWWGQTGQKVGSSVLRWEQGRCGAAGEERLLQYQVLTSEELFRKYLRAAEPIQVRLVSSRTGSLVGTAAVPVPGKLVNFRVGEQVEVAGRADIVSGSGFGLGEICFEFELQFDKLEKFTGPDKENSSKNMVQQAAKKPLTVVLPEQELQLKRTAVTLYEGKQVKSFRSLDNRSRSKVLNYLSGNVLSGSEEETLSEICSISPAESMLDALNKFDAAPEPMKAEYLNSIDSARMLIEGLNFTKAGLKEIMHKTKLASLVDVGFQIKVKLPSQTNAGSKLRFPSTQIVSDSGEVVFNGKAISKISIPKKVDDCRFEFLIYLTMGPVFHQRSTTGRQIFLGSSVIKLEELVSSRFACYKKCPVRLASDDILLGMLTVRLELGARGLHFGPELIDALNVGKENVTISSSSSESDLPTQCWSFKPLQKCPMSAPSYPSLYCRPLACSQDQHGPTQNAPKDLSPAQDSPPSGAPNSQQQDGSQQQQGAASREDTGPKAMDTTVETPPERPTAVLYGLLHLGKLKDVPALTAGGGYFLVMHGFWSSEEDGPILTTELSRDGESTNNCKSINYLITFPVMPNARFLERTKNQHMLVELWEKTPDATEKLVGVTRLPLHQFYIAFRDAQLTEHLSRAKLPVISIDAWSGITSPLAADPCGQVQAVLAIGTENQVEYLKLFRGLTHTSGDAPMTSNKPTVPKGKQDDPPHQSMVTPSTAIDHQRDIESYRPIRTSNTGKQQSEVANMLSAFIENLAQRLPISSERSTAPCYDQNFADNRQATPPPALSSSPHSQANHPQLRKTSDLLENLQRALAQRPSENLTTNLLTTSSEPASEAPQTEKQQSQVADEKLFQVSIEIEQAVNLPKVNVGKKFGKRNKNRSQQGSNQQQQQRVEVEPSAYVTFEGYNLQPGAADTVKSHEGIVYTTAIVEGCCNPSWRKKFDVRLPVDLMTNDEKRFILKVWRKTPTSNTTGSSAKQPLVPAPMEDAVVGFTAVDLSVFLNGMPCILGWYNIMDFSGRCNGQIKVNIQPLENVTMYKGLEEGVNFQIPLSIDVDCGGLDTAGNTSLSRALKRKFTELEEITQRLKARLFDVTGDENVDPDEEFERDLNTEADEEDEDEWVDPLEDRSSGQKRNSQFPNGSLQTRTTNTCSYTMSADHRVSERSLTGCSDRSTQIDSNAEKQMLLEKLLKSHDLDTLINPNILKNLINPIMSASESTPMSNPYEHIPESESSGGTSADADMSEDSVAAGGGCTSDKVKLISSALQRTTISDDSTTPTTTGKTTEGGSSGRQDSTEGSSKREAPEGEPMKVNDK
ncbi:uncharacterized protein LOC109408746 [Aedes albopictus]|uniref:C2 domain-containing protein n=1 Tax=Aedes albopictus TaxID=7160 RepID=A0ABM1ZXS2_AEDAL